jgi:acetyl esterase/lipase
MAFDRLPPQPPIFPAEAEAYSQRALDLSRAAARLCDVVFDVAYGPDPRQALDIYRPTAGTGDALPVLFFIHGGAWTNGYKEWMGLLAPAVTGIPAIFVSGSCRLAPEHRFPVPFDDCLAALAWIHANIGRHGGDPQRIFVGGHSSGGHLTTLAALRHEDLVAAGVPRSTIRGCLPVSSRFNMVFDNPAPGTPEHRHQTMLFVPGQDAVPASPYHQIGDCRIPFLLCWGERDIPSIIDNNERMHAALQRHGTPVERLVLADHDHFDTATEIRHADGPWLLAVRKRMHAN